jgi:hypothetical protein
MTPEKILDLTVKFGVVPLMFYWIIVLDKKLTSVETRLYDCYEDQIHTRPLTDKRALDVVEWLAILPNEIKIKHEVN